MPEFASVRAAATSNIALSGTAVIDEVSLLAGESVLAAGQSAGSQVGIYTVAEGDWVRRSDADASAKFASGTTVYVREGKDHGRSTFQFQNPITPDLGTTILTFNKIARSRVLGAGDGLVVNESAATIGKLRPLDGLVDGSGTFTNPTVIFDGTGTAKYVETGTVPGNFMAGLRPAYVSANSVRVGEGIAWMPSLDATRELVVDTPLTGLTLEVSSWSYLYLYESADGVAVEHSTVAPVNADSSGFSNPAGYSLLGDARVKGPAASPDFSRRYIGPIRCSSTANTMHNFVARGNGNTLFYRWLVNTLVEPFEILEGGTSTTTPTPVSCAAVAPPTSRTVRVLLKNGATSGFARIHAADMAVTHVGLSPGEAMTDDIPLTATQTFGYSYGTAPTGGGLDIDILGFYEER